MAISILFAELCLIALASSSAHVLGTINPTATRSAATTHAVVTIGSSASSHPTIPPAAMQTMTRSAAVIPPTPRRMASVKISVVNTACVPAMTRLHEAPAARCDRHATIVRAAQISQVPRCGRVVPRKMSRT